MRRGTTPTITLTLNGIDLTLTQKILVTLTQNELEINKTNDELIVDNNVITFKLTQAETLQLNVGSVELQVRGLLDTGDAFATEISTLRVLNVLNDEVLL